MELPKLEEGEKVITNYRIRSRYRKNPKPQPSPTNSIQDLFRFPPENDVVQIESPSNPTNPKKGKAVAEAPAAKRRRADVSNDTNDDANDPDLPAKLSEKFMTYIRGLGFAGEPTLVIQKKLFPTDLSIPHQRLAIPMSQILSAEFFSLVKGKKGSSPTLIDERLVETSINFNKWTSNDQYVLTSPWNEIVKENGLRNGQKIQLWSFIMNNNLYFVLVHNPSKPSV